MSNVVDIGDIRFTRKGRNWKRETECNHLHLTLVANGEMVICDDCEKQLTAWYTLTKLVDQWGKAKTLEQHRLSAVEEAEKRTIILRAAQRVEKAWRSRSMVPTCPHCRAPIFATDGFGRETIHKRFATSCKDTP